MGIRVFTHSCEEDGIFRSYFIPLQDHCEEQAEEVLPSCCQKSIQKACLIPEMEKDCCTDEVTVFKINLEYYSDCSIAIPAFLIPKGIEKFETKIEINTEQHRDVTSFTDPPPKPSGKDILIQYQVFQI